MVTTAIKNTSIKKNKETRLARFALFITNVIIFFICVSIVKSFIKQNIFSKKKF